MKLKVVSGENFSFTGNVKTLIEGLSRVMMVTGYVSSTDVGRHHLLVSYKGSVFLCGYSTETGCILKLDGFVGKRDGSVSLKEPEKLSKLLKGRTELKFSYKDQELSISEVKGRFSCTTASNFVTFDQTDRIEAIVSSAANSKESIDGALLESIREGVRRCKIADVHMNKTLLCAIRFDGKYLRVNSTCPYHAADFYTKVKSKAEPFTIALPGTMFSTVDKFVGDSAVSFSMSPTSFLSFGEGFIISFPPIDVDVRRFEEVDQYIETLKNPVAGFDLDAGFRTMQVNFSAYATNGERFTVDINNKAVSFSLKTDSGSTEDKLKPKNLKCDEPLRVLIEPRTLDDILKLCPKDGGYIGFHPMEKGSTEIRSYHIEFKIDNARLIYSSSTLE